MKTKKLLLPLLSVGCVVLPVMVGISSCSNKTYDETQLAKYDAVSKIEGAAAEAIGRNPGAERDIIWARDLCFTYIEKYTHIGQFVGISYFGTFPEAVGRNPGAKNDTASAALLGMICMLNTPNEKAAGIGAATASAVTALGKNPGARTQIYNSLLEIIYWSMR